MRLVCVSTAIAALSCAEVDPPRTPATREDLAAAFHERTCSAVIAAYANGARPSMLEIELPGPNSDDPPARVLLMAPHIVSAESCLGQPDPFAAATNEPDRSATTVATATPTTNRRAPASAPPSDHKPQPLDTRN